MIIFINLDHLISFNGFWTENWSFFIGMFQDAPKLCKKCTCLQVRMAVHIGLHRQNFRFYHANMPALVSLLSPLLTYKNFYCQVSAATQNLIQTWKIWTLWTQKESKILCKNEFSSTPDYNHPHLESSPWSTQFLTILFKLRRDSQSATILK